MYPISKKNCRMKILSQKRCWAVETQNSPLCSQTFLLLSVQYQMQKTTFISCFVLQTGFLLLSCMPDSLLLLMMLCWCHLPYCYSNVRHSAIMRQISRADLYRRAPLILHIFPCVRLQYWTCANHQGSLNLQCEDLWWISAATSLSGNINPECRRQGSPIA